MATDRNAFYIRWPFFRDLLQDLHEASHVWSELGCADRQKILRPTRDYNAE